MKELNTVTNWDSTIIDVPIRSFINFMSKVQIEREWAETKAVKRIKEQNAERNNTWEFLWRNQIKKQQTKFRYIKKSYKWLVRMKYVNNLLPILDKLSIRNSENFLNARCVACLAGIEDQDHLLECVVYQKLWKNIEEEVIQLVINETLIFITNKRKLEELRILLEEADSNDPYKKRKELLLGIFSRDAEVRLREIAGSKKKAERVAITWICTAWKVFYRRL